MTARHAGESRPTTDEDLLNEGFIRIIQYRDDWLRIAGWIEAHAIDGRQPGFIARLTASIEDAI